MAWIIEGKSIEVALTHTCHMINTTYIWTKETMSLKPTQAEMLDIKPTATGGGGRGRLPQKAINFNDPDT